MNKYLKFGFIFLFFLILLIFLIKSYYFSKEKNQLIIENQVLNFELANSRNERLKGLSNRDSLCLTCSMLFDFKKTAQYNFWMKNVNFNLDILFLNQNFEIIDFQKMKTCHNSKCILYKSPPQTRYALEINADIFDFNLIGKKVYLSK